METIHPEIRAGEVFITNSGTIGKKFKKLKVYEWMAWKTKRKGKIAYNKKGEITQGYPIFIQLSEYEEKYGRAVINDTK